MTSQVYIQDMPRRKTIGTQIPAVDSTVQLDHEVQVTFSWDGLKHIGPTNQFSLAGSTRGVAPFQLTQPTVRASLSTLFLDLLGPQRTKTNEHILTYPDIIP